MVRTLKRRREQVQAEEWKASGRWLEVVNFCRVHGLHGQLEFQSCEEDEHFCCLLCGQSTEATDLPKCLFMELLQRFDFSLWLTV